MKGHLRFCYEQAKESFAVFGPPLIAGIFQKEAGRPPVCFKACGKASLKMFCRDGVVALVG